MKNICKKGLAMLIAIALCLAIIPSGFTKMSTVEAATGIKYVATSYSISGSDKGDVVAPNVPGTYPAAIFVHGLNGAGNAKGRTLTVMQDWTDKGLIDPMIVVVPQVSEHQAFVRDGILSNVIKRLDNGSYDNLSGCTVDKNKKYAITGWSMGGAVAVYGGSKCRDKISYVGALSPSQAAHFPNVNYGKDSWMLKDADTKDLKFSTDKDHCFFLSSGATEEGGDHKAAIDCWYTEFGELQDFISATWTGRDAHDWNQLFKYELFVFIYKMQKGVYPSDEVMIKAFGDSPKKTIVDSTTVVNKEQFKANIYFTGVLKEGNYLYTNIKDSNVKPHVDGKRYYAFHWKRDGVPMDERNNYHLLGADDVGHYITCEINDLFGSTSGSLSMTTSSVIGGSGTHTHTWDNGQVTKAATCTTDGEKTRTCTGCGAKTTEVIKATGHKEVEIPEVKATCEAGGKTAGKKCSVCGTVTVVQQNTAALGHNWDEGKVTKEATPTSEGIKIFTCSRCSKTYTESIAKTEKAKGPTAPKGLSSTWCTAEGKNDGKLTNVTTAMEYSLDTSFPKSKTFTCGNGEVTGLAPGTYFVRYKETENTKAGDYCGVIIGVRKNTSEEQKTTEEKKTEQTSSEDKTTEQSTEQTTQTVVDEQKDDKEPAKSMPDKKDESTTQQPVTTSDSAKESKEEKADSNDGYVSSKEITVDQLKKNALVADKKSGGKFKITKVAKKNGKVVGGSVSYMVPINKNCTKATAPDYVRLAGVKFKVTEINKNAFKNCKKIKSFTVGKNVTKIGSSAFSGCSKLKSVTIKSKKLTKIGAKAFSGISKNAKFKVPKSKLFNMAKMIKSAKAPKNVKVTH